MREGTKLKTAKTLRKSLTDAERALWARLRRRQLNGHRFRRQHPYGPYVLDFVCLEARLIVEVDGSQHMDSPSDAARDTLFRNQRFLVLRFYNNDVLGRMSHVLERISAALSRVCPHPASGHLPPRAGEGSKEGNGAKMSV